MGHGKLKKFLENETFRCLLQPHTEEVVDLGADGLSNMMISQIIIF